MLHHLTMTGSTVGLGCLLLAGCGVAPTGGAPIPPDAETTTVDGPTPLLAVNCDDLVELSVVQGALGAVAAGVDPVRVPGGSWPLEHVALAQAGALDCYWGDDAAPQEEYARYLSVTVLPAAAEHWVSRQPDLASWSRPLSGHGDAAFSDCAGSADYLYCEYDVLVGEAWLHAEVMNVGAHEDAAPIIRSLIDAVSAAGTVTPAWEATGTLPATCAQWLAEAQLTAAVGVEGITEREFPLSMPVILNGALADGLACSWSNAYSSELAMPIQVVALPGAGWAWDTAWAKQRPERSPANPMEGIGDRAFGGCTSDQNVCFIDVLVGDTWIAIDGNKQAGLDGLRAVAAAAVAGISA